MGLLLGTKLNSPQILFIFLLALLLSRGFNAKKIIAFLKENKITLFTGSAAAILLGGFWHIRNIIIYKNPLGAFVADVSGGVRLPVALLEQMLPRALGYHDHGVAAPLEAVLQRGQQPVLSLEEEGYLRHQHEVRLLAGLMPRQQHHRRAPPIRTQPPVCEPRGTGTACCCPGLVA